MKLPSKIRGNHRFLLLSWGVYFVLYLLTERFISAEKCREVHIRLDDFIPFCEIFVVPYVMWYFLIIITLWYLYTYDIPAFRRFQIYIIVTQILAFSAYILFPTRQELRPEVFPRDNFFTDLVGILYRLDTNTGVCPSLHVAYSIGMASAWLKKKDACGLWKGFVLLMSVLICLSTFFIKQHSVLDFIAAVPVCLIAEIIAYGKHLPNTICGRPQKANDV